MAKRTVTAKAWGVYYMPQRRLKGFLDWETARLKHDLYWGLSDKELAERRKKRVRVTLTAEADDGADD